MVYVMSDLHGQYDAFVEMIKKINLNKDDILYILGDTIDRGEKSIEIYEYIKDKPNIKLLMGNHEKMMADYYILGSKSSFYMWIENGGNTTYEQLKLLEKENVWEIANYFYNLKYYEIIEVNKQKYLLSHAGMYINPNKTFDENIELNLLTDSFIWLRDNPYEHTLDNHIIIHGHTPVQDDFGCNKVVRYANGNVINIDCGCAIPDTMACLRLDDGKIFYKKLV